MNIDKPHHQIIDSTVTIRPVRITSAEMMNQLVNRLSPQSNRYQFIGGSENLSPAQRNSTFGKDSHFSIAFIATISENGQSTDIGLSQFSPNTSEDIRELTVIVDDVWDHKGMGPLLTTTLIDFAKDHGVKRLYSVTEDDDIHMSELANDLGMTARPETEKNHSIVYSLDL